jgi:hypothetical protein
MTFMEYMNKLKIQRKIIIILLFNSTDEKECAICLTEKIDTMIIPCKHMCLCRGCCDDLR